MKITLGDMAESLADLNGFKGLVKNQVLLLERHLGIEQKLTSEDKKWKLIEGAI